MNKYTVLTEEQLLALCYFYEDIINQGNLNFLDLTPQYRWISPLLSQESLYHYFLTGFNYEDLSDFAYWKWQPTNVVEVLDWSKAFIKYHWIKATYSLKVLFFGLHREIPAFHEAYTAYIESIEADYDPYREESDSDVCSCGDVGCAACDSDIRGFSMNPLY